MEDGAGKNILLLVIVAVALLGGVQKSRNPVDTTTTPRTNAEIQEQINNTQREIDILREKIIREEEKKNASPYSGVIRLSYVNRSDKSNSEYIVLEHTRSTNETVSISGWTLHSNSSGVSVAIPQASKLFFANNINSEENITLAPGGIVYVVTGYSPNGASFQLNICSGYLSQFQTFIPYIYTNCPAPRTMDLSSIPKRVANDACFDYIESFPSCRIQTENLPANWNPECKDFIYNKINYNSCIQTYKNNKDFYLNDWRVYLKRSERLWKDRREEIVLYDNAGKVVSVLKY